MTSGAGQAPPPAGTGPHDPGDPVPDQLTLDDLLTQPLHAATGATLQARFESFHTLNPWVLTALERLTRNYLRGGHQRVSIAMLFEVLRYQAAQTHGDAFKLNNSHRSRYVRLLLERHPEWDGLFLTRELTAA